MAVCPQCGKQMSDDASFCPACGAIASTPQAGAGGAQPPPQGPEAGAPPPAPPQAPPPGQPLQPPAGAQQPYQPGAFPPPPPPPVKQKSGKGWKIAVVVILVVLLVIGGAVAAISLFVFSAVKAPIDVTNNYIEAVNEGDAEAAWELLHPDSPFRQNFTFSEFETDVIETSAHQLTTWNANEADVSSDRARVEVDLTFTDGSEYRAGFALRKDGGDWLIYEYE